MSSSNGNGGCILGSKSDHPDIKQPIKNIIPCTIKGITFGVNFNQPIVNCYPFTDTYLTFGEKF